MSDFYTGRGDDGTTSLLGNARVPKHHQRPQAYGTIDEAAAALGLARSLALDVESRKITAQVQRDLYAVMSEVAATPDNAERFRRINEGRVSWLEAQIEQVGGRVVMPKEFIISGDSPSSAAFDLARTIVRRAERRVSSLLASGDLQNRHLLRYLNRLSSLCYLLVLWELLQSGIDEPSLASEPDP